MKKKIFLAAIAIGAATTIYASVQNEDSKHTFINKQYDATKGWWWYQEEIEVKDKNKSKKKIIKYKVTPKENNELVERKKTRELLSQLVKLQSQTLKVQEKNIELNKKILSRLEYAFPDYVEKYGKDAKTGKKCLANESADCFVLPMMPAAQRIPVLKNFLKDPSPQNSTKWLQWQAKYFNKMSDVASGLRFAYLNGGPEAYPTDTTFSLGDGISSEKTRALRTKGYREAMIVSSLKNKIGLLIFLGKNKLFEEADNVYHSLYTYKDSYLKDMNYAIIFPSKKALEYYNQYIKERYKDNGYEDRYNFLKNIKHSVRPDLYKKYKIKMTPSVSVFYKTDKGETFDQVIVTGDASAKEIRHNIIKFLDYYDIINPKELSASTNWTTVNDRDMEKNISKPDETKILKQIGTKNEK